MNLIERLRAEHARNGGQGAYAWSSRELCGKAATEIERLTAQVEAMREALEKIDKWCCPVFCANCARNRDDARAALSYRGGD